MFIARRAPGPRSLGGNHFVDSLGLGRDALVEFARQFRDYVARRHGIQSNARTALLVSPLFVDSVQ